MRPGEIGRRQCLMHIQDLGTEFRQLKTKVMARTQKICGHKSAVQTTYTELVTEWSFTPSSTHNRPMNAELAWLPTKIK